jgi:hypothetical protein
VRPWQRLGRLLRLILWPCEEVGSDGGYEESGVM